MNIWLSDKAKAKNVPRMIKAAVAPMFVVRFFKDGFGFMCGSGGCSPMIWTRHTHYQLSGKRIDGEPIYVEKYEPMLILEDIPKVYVRLKEHRLDSLTGLS